jgi:hypothetical protein
MDEVEKLVNDVCTPDELNSGRCFQIREEFLALCRYLHSLRPNNILEIGCLGPSFNVFCRLSTGTKIAVDMDDNSARVDDMSAHFIIGNSGDVQEIIKSLCCNFDFIFVDGSHQYVDVARDFELYSPLLSSRGIMAFHDIDPNHHFADRDGGSVYRFWKDLDRGHKTSVICERTDHSSRYKGHSTHFGGIGIWRP